MTQNPTLSEREEIARLIAPRAFKQADYAHDWNRRHHPEDGVWGAFAQAGVWLGSVQEAFDTADAIFARRAPVAPAEPVAWKCDGCDRTCADPEADLLELRSQGAISCCPERRMRLAQPAQPSTVTVEGDHEPAGWGLIDPETGEWKSNKLLPSEADAQASAARLRDSGLDLEPRALYAAPPAPSPVTGALVEALTRSPAIEELTPAPWEWNACVSVQDQYDLMKRKVRSAAALAAQKAEG